MCPIVFARLGSGGSAILVGIPSVNVLARNFNLSSTVRVTHSTVKTGKVALRSLNERVPIPDSVSSVSVGGNAFSGSNVDRISFISVSFSRCHHGASGGAMQEGIALPG